MTAPELRFPEFETPWREATAGDAFANSKAKGEAGLPIWSVTQDRGLVPRDSIDRHLDSNAADETHLRAQPGDLVYNMMRMWQGAVGRATEECMVSPAYVVLSPKGNTSSDFFDNWFNAPRMLYRLWAYSHGLTNDRLRLYYADFAKIPIAIPEVAEQQKIAAFLDVVSSKILLLNRQKTSLIDFKRGIMERIFSQELRFSQDDGTNFPDWKARKLKEVFIEISERGNPGGELLSVTMTKGIRRAHEVNRTQGASTDRSNYKTVMPGDIAYNSMRMWQGASGLSTFEGIVSPAYTVIRPTDGQDGRFWAHCFKLPRMVGLFRRYSQGMTSDTWSLKFGSLSAITFAMPSLDEQRKIAEALDNLDVKIDAVACQIAEMESFKRGLLQKLFI